MIRRADMRHTPPDSGKVSLYHSAKYETSMMVFHKFDNISSPNHSLFVLFSGAEADIHQRALNALTDEKYDNEWYCNGSPITVGYEELADFAESYGYKKCIIE
jgi:hypothetical protein